MKNPVVSEAVAAFNKEKADQAIAEATDLTSRIAEKQEAVMGCNARIAGHRAELAKIAGSAITVESIYGGSLPSNANAKTISEVIEKVNKNRQFGIEQATDRLTKAIVAEQDAIKGFEKQIAELREKILAIKPVEVTASQIAG